MPLTVSAPRAERRARPFRLSFVLQALSAVALCFAGFANAQNFVANPNPNLVQNGNFAGGLTGWEQYSASDATVAWSSQYTATNDGSGSAFVKRSNAVSASGLMLVQQAIATTPGATYQLSGRILISTSCSGCRADVIVYWTHAGSNQLTLYNAGFTSTDGFYSASTNVVAPPDGSTAHVALGVSTPLGGTVGAYFDDVSLTLVANASSTTVTPIPASPTYTDRVRFSVDGSWPNSCVPAFPTTNDASVSGNTITLTAVTNASCLIGALSSCFAGTTPYSITTNNAVGPLAPGTYTVDYGVYDGCTGKRTSYAQRTLTIAAAPVPVISFTATPQTIDSGASSTLAWSVQNATAIAIDNGIGNVAASGSLRVSPSQSTTYTLTASGGGRTVTATARVEVLPPVAGWIIGVPDVIRDGESAVLTWSSSGGSLVSISDGLSNELVAASGTKIVAPHVTTRFTLTVSNGSAFASSTALVTVLNAATPVISTFMASPVSIGNGSQVLLSWTSSGGKSASIDNGVGPVSLSGTRSVSPGSTTTYTLTVRSDAGSASRTATVTVGTAPAPAVSTLAGTGQAGSSDGPPSQASFTRPFAVTSVPQLSQSSGGFDAEADAVHGDLLVLDSNHTIRRISSDGRTSTWAGRPGVRGTANGFRTDATFDFSNYTGAIVANADGSADVVDANGLQRHIDALGNVTNACASCARFPLPAGVVRLKDGTIYVSDAAAHTVTRRHAGADTVIGASGHPGLRDGSAAEAQFNRPRGMTVDAAGNVYVLDTGNNAVRRIDPTNAVSTMTVAGSGAGAGGDLALGCCAGGIAADPSGGVYVTDPGSNTVKQVHTDGSVTTVAGSGSSGSTNGSGSSASFSNPLGLATNPDGSLVVTDTNNNNLRLVNPAGERPSRHRGVRPTETAPPPRGSS